MSSQGSLLYRIHCTLHIQWLFGRGLPKYPERPGEGGMWHALGKQTVTRTCFHQYPHVQEGSPGPGARAGKWALLSEIMQVSTGYEAKMSCSYTEKLETLGSDIYYLPFHVCLYPGVLSPLQDLSHSPHTSPAPHLYASQSSKHPSKMTSPSGQLLGKKLHHNLCHTKN